MTRSHLRQIVTDRAGNVLQNAAVTVLPLGTVTLEAEPIDPTTVNGLHTRYDFSDISTLFQDTALTTPVTADGDSIQGLADLTANGHDAIITDSNGPLYKEAIRNSLSVGRFTGDDALVSTFANLPQPSTAFVVAKNGTQWGFFYDGIGTIGKRYAMRNIDAAVIASDPLVIPGGWISGGVMIVARQSGDGYEDASFFQVDPAGIDSNFHIWMAEYTGATSELWGDGTLRVTGNAGPDGADGLTIGCSASQSNVLEFMNGDFCEFLLFDSALSDFDRDGVTAYLLEKWGFGAEANTLVGNIYAAPSGGVPISNQLVSDERGVVEAWFDFPQNLVLHVSDNENTTIVPAAPTAMLSFEDFEVEARPGESIGLNTRVQHVHPNGSNAADGLSWVTAKADVVSAFDALSTGGTIRVADGAFMDSVDTTLGLWLMGSTDTNVADPPPGWRRSKPLILEGVGGSSGILSKTPQIRLRGGDEADPSKPTLWLSSGANQGFEMRNIRLAGAAICAKLGIDSNNVIRNRDTAFLKAENCGFEVVQLPAAGPVIDMGYFFWWTFDQCSFQIPTRKLDLTGVTRSGSTATFTATNAWLGIHGLQVGDLVVTEGFDQTEYNGIMEVTAVPTDLTFTAEVTGAPTTPGTGTDMKSLGWETDGRYAINCFVGPTGANAGIGEMLECNLAAGGLMRYHGTGDVGTMTMKNIVQEGSGSGYEPSIVRLIKRGFGYQTFGPWFVENMFSADTGENQRPVIDIDPGYEVWGLHVEHAVSSTSGVTPVQGEGTVLWQADPGQRQVGSDHKGRYVGPIDAHRRAFAPTAVRHSNLAPHATATWAAASGTATVTQTKRAPDGTTTAALLSSAGGARERVIYSASRSLAVGDWILTGCWVRATTAEGTVTSPVVASWTNAGNLFTRHSGVSPGISIAARPEPHPDLRWQWIWEADRVDVAGVTPDTLYMRFTVDATHPAEFHAPVLIHVPAADGLDQAEAMEYAYNLASSPDGATVGEVTTLATHTTNTAGGLKVGSGTKIVKHLSFVLVALNIGNVVTQTTENTTVAASGAVVGDICYANPVGGALENGLTWSAFVSAPDIVTIRMNNPTVADINPAAADWRVDVWKH